MRESMRGTHGFTLVETVVVLGIFAIVTALVAFVITRAADLTRLTDARAEATGQAVDSTEHLRTLITGGSIIAAGSSVLIVDRDAVGRCERYTWTVDRDATGAPLTLRETVQAIPVGEAGTCADITASAWSNVTADVQRVLVEQMSANPSGTPVWQFYSRGNAVLDASSSGANAALPCAIARVDITVTAYSDAGGQVPVTASAAAAPTGAAIGVRCP